MPSAKIVVTEQSFTIISPKKAPVTVSLDEVTAIVAYKLDVLTTDLICCDVAIGSPGAEKVYTLHEDLPGFDMLMVRFETLPGFDRDWRGKVVLPPFAENRTAIFPMAIRP